MAARPGNKHHAAKLTAAQVRQARRSYATGKWTYVGLAEKYGVSKQAMAAAVTGRTWAHLS